MNTEVTKSAVMWNRIEISLDSFSKRECVCVGGGGGGGGQDSPTLHNTLYYMPPLFY